VLVTVRVVLRDGREFDLAQEVEDGARLSPDEVVARAANEGRLAVSDSAEIALDEIDRLELAPPDSPAGPGWGPGLQDEDALSAADGGYRAG
jgi:hypothetical protein